ncbi:MAG: methylated-DNA--[protein]-cysteine S-methyltransferase, partial [Gemmatimonadaceae bacterium]
MASAVSTRHASPVVATPPVPRSRESLRVTVVPCSLGLALVACSEAGVRALLLGDDAQALRDDLARRFPRAELLEGDASDAVVRAALCVLESPQDVSSRTLPLDPAGTVFQRRVWEALRRIPPGRTATYTDIAQQLGAPTASRAVAQACAANPLAVLVPCHRVIR